MPTVCGGWTLLDRSGGVTEEEGSGFEFFLGVLIVAVVRDGLMRGTGDGSRMPAAVVELLEALSWAVEEKWVRLRVVMVIGSMHEGVKACLGWSLRW
ncbi:hypothetical protein NC652_028845 [Populus alba x Populus x berolinensis]|nr:hypothetical protein NC652_028786 [Populus alba x Populus x berolinensis]KAJ6887696.1 hypothetical protein NC652_028845 [Populus alba x Populus x berolinensis]